MMAGFTLKVIIGEQFYPKNLSFVDFPACLSFFLIAGISMQITNFQAKMVLEYIVLSIIIVLPMANLLRLLPPVLALVPWFLEKINTILFGSTLIPSLTLLIFSAVTFGSLTVASFHLPNVFYLSTFTSSVGFLYATAFPNLFFQQLECWIRLKKNRNASYLPKWYKTVLYHLIYLILSGITPLVCHEKVDFNFMNSKTKKFIIF